MSDLLPSTSKWQQEKNKQIGRKNSYQSLIVLFKHIKKYTKQFGPSLGTDSNDNNCKLISMR